MRMINHKNDIFQRQTIRAKNMVVSCRSDTNKNSKLTITDKSIIQHPITNKGENFSASLQTVKEQDIIKGSQNNLKTFLSLQTKPCLSNQMKHNHKMPKFKLHTFRI